MSVLAVYALVAVAGGLLAARWRVVILAAAAGTLYFLGLHEGWWGYGVGDGWEFAMAAATVAAAGGAAAGVALRRAVARQRRGGDGRRSRMDTRVRSRRFT